MMRDDISVIVHCDFDGDEGGRDTNLDTVKSIRIAREGRVKMRKPEYASDSERVKRAV